MSGHEPLWAIVLAAGDGRRLQGLTTQGGVAVPKQFCALEHGPSLLQEALDRAHSVVRRERICTVVASAHRRWWSGRLEGVPAANVVVQPRNRGTANGILLPLLTILERDPHALSAFPVAPGRCRPGEARASLSRSRSALRVAARDRRLRGAA